MSILSNVENIDFGLNEEGKNNSKCSESDTNQDNAGFISNNGQVNSTSCGDEAASSSNESEPDADDPDYSDNESGNEAVANKHRNKGRTRRKDNTDDDISASDFESDNEGTDIDDESGKGAKQVRKRHKKEETELSEYELRRNKNVAEFKKLFREMFGTDPGPSPEEELSTLNSSRGERPGQRKRKRRTSLDSEDRSYSARRYSLPLPIRRSARVNARRSGGNGLVFSWNSKWTPFQKLEKLIEMRYGGDWPKNEKYSDSSGDEEDDDNNFLGFREGFRGFQDIKPFKKRRNTTLREWKPRINVNRTIIPPEEITDSQLANISYKSANKIYDVVKGTTCHQCRQKTLDTKTICRSDNCSGVRGQFCGFCLKSRYGEDAAEALKDPNWECPPCRNICNCSICRTRRGKIPTGILTPQAIEKGYDSVHHFLKALKEDEL